MSVHFTPHAASLSGCLFTAAPLGQCSHPAPLGAESAARRLPKEFEQWLQT
jgi:hypothetical protein